MGLEPRGSNRRASHFACGVGCDAKGGLKKLLVLRCAKVSIRILGHRGTLFPNCRGSNTLSENCFRNTWRASLAGEVEDNCAPPQQVCCWAEVAADFNIPRRRLHQMPDILRTHALAVAVGHATSQASFNGSSRASEEDRSEQCWFCQADQGSRESCLCLARMGR